MNPKDAAATYRARLDLVPPTMLVLAADAFWAGARKYGAYNWRREEVAASTYVAATMRHLLAWWDGEDLDQETGLSHIAHAIASLGVLIDAIACGNIDDDRPTSGRAGDLIRSARYRMQAVERPCGDDQGESRSTA